MLPMALQHGGAGLRIGEDAGFPVTEAYTVPGRFTGTVQAIRVVTPEAGHPRRRPDEVRAALHAD
jgi:arylsulfatase